ncbi:MAG TPA: aminopeptidase [Syntrophomonas sp.]|nr:aminopeptidase [Syntrophomonas sp.]HRW11932.1 aminopeptidase [Syntrophomonas sp.]
MAEKKPKKHEDSWSRMNASEIKACEQFNAGYIDFLSQVKTEREAVAYISTEAFRKGFKEIEQVKKIKPGDKLIIQLKSKVAALVVIGNQPLEKGVNLIASHIDSPRLDLKPHPAYEADGMALFKTHYYGGIKKYQWLAIPLALHGVVVKKDGRIIEVSIGEKADDPVFTIADLLPHLAKDQMERKMADAVKGEDLNAILGSRPLHDQEDEAIKTRVLNILKDQYEIEEDDFTSAELQFVPAFPARELGLDRSMIAAYGQDDRVSAYASLQAILAMEKPERTVLCLFADKEEIGSSGNTGLQSLLIENVFAELMHKTGQNDYFSLRKALANSAAISADVNAAVDPNYPEVFEKMNCSFLSRGVVLTKYTGSRGKYDSNDANPEFMAQIRKIFDDAGVVWQVGELGKVDIGGGGTVAQYIARYGMEVVDCGVALLGMHSPFEVASKADVYMSYKGYQAFLQKYLP